MGRHELNRRALEHAKVMVKDGHYVDEPWSFSAEDGNALLGEKGKENWSEYAQWFLGLDTSEQQQTKAHYSYPYGKGGKLYLSALRAIISRAGQNKDGAIQDAARELLTAAQGKDKDRETASGGDFDIVLSGGIPVDIVAGAMGEDGQPQLHRFHMEAYNGGPMMLKGGRKDIDYSKPIIVDLDGMSGIDKSRPALYAHDPERPVGHTETITAAGGKLTADGVISNPYSPHAFQVTHSSKNKFPWQASIGANIGKAEWVPAGEQRQVNGRTVTGPLTIARTSRLGEISFVALGADDSTSAFIASQGGGKGNTMGKFKAWMKAAGYNDDDLQGSKGKTIRAAWKCSKEYDKDDKDGEEPESEKEKEKEAEQEGKGKRAKAAAGDLDTAAAGGIDQIRAESLRINSINTSADTHIQAFAKAPKVVEKLTSIRDKAISDGISAVEAAKDLELTALREGRGVVAGSSAAEHPFNINSGGVGMNITGDIIAAAIGLSGGLDEKHALTDKAGRPLSDQAKEIATSKQFRGAGLQHLVGYVAAAHGMHLRPGPLRDDDIRKVMAIEARAELLGGGGNFDVQADGYSTVTLLGITENLMNKMMLQGYDEQPSAVDSICWQRDTNDFKPFKSYRMTGSGRMQLVADSGELKSMGLQDESYQNQLQTRGVVITISRQTILNDDMGALTDQPKAIGREAMMTREEVTFTLLFQLIAGTVQYNTSPPGATATLVNFFSTTLTNYMSGATSALSISSLTTAVQKFMEQVDANGRPINVMPDRLLCAPALRETAMTINKGSTVVISGLNLPASSSGTSAAQAASKIPNPNLYQNQFLPVVSPFMAARGGKGLNGSNDTQWLLLPNPSSGLAIMQIGYLRGNRTPIIERGEAPFSTLGMHMRGYYDFGVAAHDYRAGVYSAGQ